MGDDCADKSAPSPLTPPRVDIQTATGRKKRASRDSVQTVFRLIHPTIVGSSEISVPIIRARFGKLVAVRRIYTILNVLVGLGYIEMTGTKKVLRFVGVEGIGRNTCIDYRWPECAKEAFKLICMFRRNKGFVALDNYERQYYDMMNILEELGLAKRYKARHYYALYPFYEQAPPPPPPPPEQLEWLRVEQDEKTESLLAQLPF